MHCPFQHIVWANRGKLGWLNGGLTRDLQIARPHHHVIFAVYPAASPHAVLRIGTSEGTKCQGLDEVLFDDRCRVKAFASRGWEKLQEARIDRAHSTTK
jgi:hypothetical protein